MGVLDKAVLLLSMLAEKGPARPLGLAEASGISRPTTHRLLAALQAHALVSRAASGEYRLGWRHIEWGARAAAGQDLVAAARPILDRLRDQSGLSSQLYVRDGDVRICVAASEPVSGLRDTVPVGTSLPLGRGSGGKVLLAWSEDGAEILAAVRSQGWAGSVAEREPGVGSVSAPVLGRDGRLLGALSISGPLHRLGNNPGPRWAPAIMAAARELERRLGGG